MAVNGPTIRYQRNSDRAYIADITENILRGLMNNAGVERVVITSTYRDPEKQTDLMYDVATRLEVKKPGTTTSMYNKKMGDKVMQVARNQIMDAKAGIKDGFNPNTPLPLPSNTKAAMSKTIHAMETSHGTGCVSRHQLLLPNLNVFDLDTASLQPASALDKFIDILTSSHFVKKLGLPNGKMAFSTKHFHESEKCIHVEMEVPRLNDGVVRSSASLTA